MDWRWKFQASLLRVIDGDTFWMRVDCGFRIFAEHGEPESRFVLETDRDRQTFNRYIARVACPEGHDLGAAIVAAGYGAAA